MITSLGVFASARSAYLVPGPGPHCSPIQVNNYDATELTYILVPGPHCPAHQNIYNMYVPILNFNKQKVILISFKFPFSWKNQSRSIMAKTKIIYFSKVNPSFDWFHLGFLYSASPSCILAEKTLMDWDEKITILVISWLLLSCYISIQFLI